MILASSQHTLIRGLELSYHGYNEAYLGGILRAFRHVGFLFRGLGGKQPQSLFLAVERHLPISGRVCPGGAGGEWW